MTVSDTHAALVRLAGLAGWDSETLLLLIARWAEDNGAARPLIEHLSRLALAEAADEKDGGPAVPATGIHTTGRDATSLEPFRREAMAEFTVETTYRVPVFRHGTYSAETAEAACRLAIEDDDWSAQTKDYESAGETYVTGIWQGADAAYRGPALPVLPNFGEAVQRQAAHFEVLLGLLKIMVADAEAGRATAPEWLAKAVWAIALAEAILAGARGPDEPAELPALPYVLAELHEHRVRDQIAGIVETDPEFVGLAVEAVTDADIRAACIAVAAAIDLSEETGGAEFRAGLAALRRAQARSAAGA